MQAAGGPAQHHHCMAVSVKACKTGLTKPGGHGTYTHCPQLRKRHIADEAE